MSGRLHPAVTTAVAAVTPKAEVTELVQFAVPEVAPFEGLLEVQASGVCGTDWAFYTRSRGAHLGPLILGHETVGRIAALGEGAAERWDVAVGDVVAVEEFIPCGTCLRCRRGDYRLCAATDSRSAGAFLRYGATPVSVGSGLWGGFATHLHLDRNSVLYRVPDGLDAELATLFVPISNGIQWVVLEGNGRVGESLLVIGPGQHGLGCVVAARHAGMGPIVVAGLSRDRRRLALAREFGADLTIELDRQPLETARSILDDGADMIVDVTPGAVAPIEEAVDVAAVSGRMILAGGKGGGSVQLDHDRIVRKELTVRGIRGHDTRSVVPALQLISEQRDLLSELCTHRLPLASTDTALRLVGERTDADAIHVAVMPWET